MLMVIVFPAPQRRIVRPAVGGRARAAPRHAASNPGLPRPGHRGPDLL